MNPIMTGVVQNQDSYMKGKIAQRHFYDKVPAAVQEAMDEYYAKTGRRYRMVDFYRMDDAEYALVGMGGMMETAQVAADYMREEMDLKVGVRSRHLLRAVPGHATRGRAQERQGHDRRRAHGQPARAIQSARARHQGSASPTRSQDSATVRVATSTIRRLPASRRFTPAPPASARAM